MCTFIFAGISMYCYLLLGQWWFQGVYICDMGIKADLPPWHPWQHFWRAPLEPFPIWPQYSKYGYSCGHLHTHCLELFGKNRCGQDWPESRTGWNPGLDRVQIVQNNYGSFNSLPVMPATSYLHTQQIPATCVVLQSASQNSSRSNYSILFHVLVSEASSSQSLLCVIVLITLMYDDSMLHMCQ